MAPNKAIICVPVTATVVGKVVIPACTTLTLLLLLFFLTTRSMLLGGTSVFQNISTVMCWLNAAEAAGVTVENEALPAGSNVTRGSGTLCNSGILGLSLLRHETANKTRTASRLYMCFFILFSFIF